MANLAGDVIEDSSPFMSTVTCTAPVNIAVIKYWGKRDESLILPVNSSLSATLGQDELRAKTTVAASRSFSQDRMWLNGREQDINNPRLQNVLKEIRRRGRKRKAPGDTAIDLSSSRMEEMLSWHVHICSENNFPTAAGLASSAAGYACLVYSLAKLFRVDGDISEIARKGSGSACRSVYGGFVEWRMGKEIDGSDSIAKQIKPHTHWPQLRILILVVSSQKKHVGSTQGMQTSVKTSELIDHRAKNIVPERMKMITRAIHNRDFPAFAEITMKDSNQFHAVCLDTYPPISYLTDTSKHIIHMVHRYNQHMKATKVAYTFDAGPNACLYLLEQDVPAVLGAVKHFFPPADSENSNFVQGISSNSQPPSQGLKDAVGLEPESGAVKYIIHTKVGDGPQVVKRDEESLLAESGMPKVLA